MDREILLIEDNADDEELVVLALTEAGVANPVRVLRDGAAALEYLFTVDRESLRLPRVVLLDLQLPRVNGLQVLRRIRADERTRHLPVVVLTSSDADEDILGSYETGANSYVRKPVDFVEFSGAVRTLGIYWLLLNRPPPR